MSADVSYLLLGFTTLMLLGFGLQIAIVRKRRGEYIVYKPLLLLALVVLWGLSLVSVVTGKSISELTGGVIG
ncbi:hypothetical protein SAMN02745121_08995 [Nannocystis exedens]|uniref:Uncharacterized protein n=2 Tax=Nannocystis TaxID=53 RepID=A0A1I2IUM5_9BACT|nr:MULTISPECIES: hypothetical protein [Nannocystis]MDC0672379.1 hypothetical protein [Nannocystis radixulma]PCC67116.1 hypothetical protein NAEX_00119 [Nannocystis exedens]SFF45984.1 hypothetical protein SAMN02745121_08995 [Nannocystis exedens]